MPTNREARILITLLITVVALTLGALILYPFV